MINRLRSASLLLTLSLFLSGCGEQGSDEPVSVSVIGPAPAKRIDPNRRPLNPPESVLIAATRQGLVRYDADGQIEAGLAIRWSISDDGLYYTFRLADIEGLTADQVANTLKATIARASRNALLPLLGAISDIVAVTPEVVEIRLRAARPNLLDLLAQPEMGITLPKQDGTGPFAIAKAGNGTLLLDLMPREFPDDTPSETEQRRHRVLLRSESSALSIARFAAGRSSLVTQGRFQDMPIVQVARLRGNPLRLDPVDGLFGLAFAKRAGFLASVENRRALASAIDRNAVIMMFGAIGWQPAYAILPSGTIEVPHPTQPGWSETDLATRRMAAADTIRFWRAQGGEGQPHVRVSLPQGPGSILLFALLRANWAAIGVTAERVAADADADLVLIDEVAPSQGATWYLRRFSCDRSAVCSEAADDALLVARSTPDFNERLARIADADLRLFEVVPFIPLARPMRWSLVAPRLSGFKTNNRAVHPLNHLIEDNR